MHEFDPDKVPTVGELLNELPVKKTENSEEKMEVDEGEGGAVPKGQGQCLDLVCSFRTTSLTSSIIRLGK